MKEKRTYVKVRVIDRNHRNFGKVIDVYKLEDTRFFANRWGAKYGPCAYFSDQLSFTPYDPIPVMYNLSNDPRGPWTLGYVHLDDIKKVTPKGEVSQRYGEQYVRVNDGKTELHVYGMHDGIPAMPKLVMPLNLFHAPTWSPSWRWDVYCENREKAKTEKKIV